MSKPRSNSKPPRIITSANNARNGHRTTDAVDRILRELESEETPSAHASNPGIVPVTIRLSDVVAETVSWLWPQRFPLGKLSIIAGDPGLGKSFLTCEIAARVTRGAPWPDAATNVAPSGVIMLNCEDGLADTIRPRLDSHQADTTRVVALQAVRSASITERQRPFDLSRDLDALEKAIIDMPDCRVVVIDPLSAYLGEIDSHRNDEVRAILAPLCTLAVKYGIAVIGVTHLNKGSGAAIYRTMGSLAFVAAARSAWCVAGDKSNPSRRLLLPVKNNLGNDSTGLAFSIVDGRIEWEDGPIVTSVDEALALPHRRSTASSDDATEWLRSYLSDGKPRPAKGVIEAANAHGIKEKPLRRAAKSLFVEISKKGMKGGWVWTLQTDDVPEDAEDTPLF